MVLTKNATNGSALEGLGTSLRAVSYNNGISVPSQ